MDDEFSKFYSECSELQSESNVERKSQNAVQPKINADPLSEEKPEESASTSDLSNTVIPKESMLPEEISEAVTNETEKTEKTASDLHPAISKESVIPEEISNAVTDNIANTEGGRITEINSTSEAVSALSADCNKANPSNKFAEHTRYEGNECIYTNPDTKEEFVWSDAMKQWVPKGYKPVFDGKTYQYTDPEGVTFKWNPEGKEWIKSENEDGGSSRQYGFDGENHTYTDPKDNTVYIWDKDKNAWFPKVDEDFMARYQMSYGFVDNTTKEEEKPAEEKKAEKRKPSDPTWFELDDTQNTKVYVSNLPEDISEQEFIDLMQKCGLILKDIKTNKFKIKLYKDSNGMPKGDALCDYIKIESVELALNVLDGSNVRGKKIKVQRAKFEMKGNYDPSLKPKKKRKKDKEQERKVQQKLLDWRPDKLRGEREKHERTIVIKNLFDPKIFDENVELILEYTEDIRSEASKCGQVRKVTLYDKNPEGVCTVTFSDAEEADICLKLFSNRWFGKRKILAETWDGKTKYKVVENAQETKQRLDNWNKFLESEERIKK